MLLLHIRGIKYSKILANTLISIIRGHSAHFFFMTQGTTSVVNLDSYVFSSIKGTLSSINMILKDGRINDSWTLLRKYHDSIIINIYSCLFLKDNFSINNFVVKKINDWIHGKSSLPEFRIMSQYIRNHGELSELNKLIYETDDRYKKLEIDAMTIPIITFLKICYSMIMRSI